MTIEVFLTGGTVLPDDVRGRTAVVIDVLRASTTITTALSHGAKAIIPVADMAEAGKMAAKLDVASYRLGGERDGVQIDGYHFGNSPREYTVEAVRDQTVILLSTNGTGAVLRAAGAAEVLIGGFVNASAIAAHARRTGRDVVLICAGWRNRISLEDTLCAGLLLELIWHGSPPGEMSDSAYTAWTLYRNDRRDLLRPISRCNHARRLERLGYAEDIPLCAAMDSIPIVPSYAEGRITAVPMAENTQTAA